MVRESRPWLMPFGLLYGQVMNLRNHFYDMGIFRSVEVGRPVISVGNLTVGGAGKTPVVMALLDLISRKGLNPAVVSRGYGRLDTAVREVELKSSHLVERYGDEPVLIKARFREIPVYVGADRVETAQALLRQHKVDVIVADDAFQHRALRRHLDIVVLDACQSLRSLKPLPWGLGREKALGLQRASVVILNKVNLSDEKRLSAWRNWLAANLPSSAVLVESAYVARPLAPLLKGGSINFESWMACAGLARPETFLNLLRQQLNLHVTSWKWFRDHHGFTKKDLDKLLSRLKPAQGVVISEKDAVKWSSIPSKLRSRVAVAGLDLQWLSGEEELANALVAVSR